MKRNETHRENEVIDLGRVTDHTKGGEMSVNDFQNGLKPIIAGLTDD